MGKPNRSKSHASAKTELTEYLRTRMREMDLTLRTAADKIGISHPYLSLLTTGKRVPDAAVCGAIADAFGDPRVKVLRYAGWLDEADIVTTHTEMDRLVENDPQFLELVKLYRNVNSEAEKKMLLKILKAAISK